jgi:hypothetical protein
MHWDLPACLPAARGGARRAAWHALGFLISCWLHGWLRYCRILSARARRRRAAPRARARGARAAA